jgi:hypothetical protein
MKDSKKTTDWWWIDYLEDLLGPDLEKDLQTLLEHSQEDRDNFEHVRLLREWLSACDPIGDWPIAERLARVESRVMAALEAPPVRRRVEEDERPSVGR